VIDDDGVLRSDIFDDVYFSADNGLEETEYVFIQGNYLQRKIEAAAGQQCVVVETGFGTGLNFLATWRLFDAVKMPETKLHFISFEKYPLSKDIIRQALAPWDQQIGDYTKCLLDNYPLRAQGMHRIHMRDDVILDIIIGDVNDYISELHIPQGVDAWYLDGFAPAKNPDMWSTILFENMARLSKADTNFATFTAAGAVKRGLESAGFDVSKQQGFGRKRDMLVGSYKTQDSPEDVHKADHKVAIIGGGLAGTACAYILKQRGLNPVLFEASDHIAAGASGNAQGLYNPRFSAERSAEAEFYSAAFMTAYRTFETLSKDHDIDFDPCGTVHLMTDDQKTKRFSKMHRKWGWGEAHMSIISAEQASKRAGVDVDFDALYLPEAGVVSPHKLCNAYVHDVECRLGAAVHDIAQSGQQWMIEGELFDSVIIANAMGAQSYKQMRWLPIYTVRGQMTEVKSQNKTAPEINICFGGYTTRVKEGIQHVGSTFQKDRDNTDNDPQDNTENLERLFDYVPQLKDKLEVLGARAALRTSSKDYFPIIGAAPDYEEWLDGGQSDMRGLYVSTAHGSHGVVSSIMGAHLIADMIVGAPHALPQNAVAQLAPDRFLRRDRKKGII